MASRNDCLLTARACCHDDCKILGDALAGFVCAGSAASVERLLQRARSTKGCKQASGETLQPS